MNKIILVNCCKMQFYLFQMTAKLSELEVIKEKIQSVKAEKIVLEEKSNKLSADLKACKKDLKE